MSEPRVSFARGDSFSSIDSEESCLDDIFENDDFDEDDFIPNWHNGPIGRDDRIFTVTNGYGFPTNRDFHSSQPYHDRRSAPIKHFTHRLTFRGWLRRFFVRNYSTRLGVAFFDLTLKLLICAAYVARVAMDDITEYECYGSPCGMVGNTTHSERDAMFADRKVNWYVLLWVQRGLIIWAVEISLHIISLIKAFLMVYIASRGHKLEAILSAPFIIDIICGVPMLATLAYPYLKNLFVPVYLNCWLAKLALERIYNDLHLTRKRFQTISVTLFQKMVLLVANISCLVFTTMCTVQHIQRASPDNPIDLFDSFYFVIVTFSTVGYGDMSPDNWISQLFMVIMICVAFASLPTQIEGIVSTYKEREKTGGEYSGWLTPQNHIIVCSSSLSQDTLMELMDELYAFPKLEERAMIILSPQELDSGMKTILRDPKWSMRVKYLKGSALKDIDLERCHAQSAYACFLLAPRPATNKEMADRTTILRSWAIKEFAPNCKQYVYLFKAANKIHVKSADYVVCEDEFTYALLANNCLYPGLSTLVSLLVHSSTVRHGTAAYQSWQRMFGHHAKNEIFHIQLKKSMFFGQYEGEPFPSASADAHTRFGVALLAVLDSQSPVPRLQLNPGPNYRLKGADICFYMSVAREEYSTVNAQVLKQMPPKRTTSIQMSPKSKTGLVTTFTQTQSDPEIGVFDTITNLLSTNLNRDTCRNNTPRDFTGTNSNSVASDTEDSNQGSDRGNHTQKNPPPRSTSSGSSAPLLKHESDESEGSVAGRGDTEDQEQQLDRRGLQDDHGSTDDDSVYSHDGAHRMGRRGFDIHLCEDTSMLTRGPPPVTTETCFGHTQCYIRLEPKPFCCVEWGKGCEHCSFKVARDQRWGHRLIILAAEHAGHGIFNFIVPLRSSFIGLDALSPIVLLLEEEPDATFLESIAEFPMVYYMIGSIKRIDDLLLAGVNRASHMVVVNRDPDPDDVEEELTHDAETVITVKTIIKFFPRVRVLTNLSQSSNMRFMKLNTQVRPLGKQTKEQSANMSLRELYRSPFAAGHVFSTGMLDTMLYQTFTKGYLIMFVKLLLGLDAMEGCGHTSSIRVRKSTVQKFPLYGDLYDHLCATSGEIPFAIYRTDRSSKDEEGKDRLSGNSGTLFDIPLGNIWDIKRKPGSLRIPKANRRFSQVLCNRRLSVVSKAAHMDVAALIRNRLKSLDLSASDCHNLRRPQNVPSYIITNPRSTEKLRRGDIIYVIQPSSMRATPSKHDFFNFRPSASFSRQNSAPESPRRGVLKATPKMGRPRSMNGGLNQLKEPDVSEIVMNGQTIEDNTKL